MNDQPSPMTPRQLRAVVHHVAVLYLEVERGLRQHRQLARILTQAEYRRHLITGRRGSADSRPVRPHDIGQVRIDHATPQHVNTNVAVRRRDGWGCLIVDLKRTGRGWQVERLDRLERLLPSEPRDVQVDQDAFARQERFIDQQRRLVARAHKATAQRYERSGDKRTRAARELRHQRDRWAARLKDVETEAAALEDRRRLGHQDGQARDRDEQEPAAERRMKVIAGPRPKNETRANLWDEAAHALKNYTDRWPSEGAITNLLTAAAGREQEGERRRLLRLFGAIAGESGTTTVVDRNLTVQAPAVQALDSSAIR